MKVLGDGYLNYVDHLGSDESIIEAARMSTSKGFQGWGPKICIACNGEGGIRFIPNGRESDVDGLGCTWCHATGKVEGDEKLLRYLYTHKHLTPFEMCDLVVEVKAPIFVLREWHRHRTQSFNELSGRYTTLPDEYYIPSVERIMAGAQSSTNKQGSADGIDEVKAVKLRAEIASAVWGARQSYDFLLAQGVSRELARVVVPVNQYSTMRAKANLRNWLHFLELRMDPAAQFEIRQYANAVAELIKQHWPRTYALFEEGVMPHTLGP